MSSRAKLNSGGKKRQRNNWIFPPLLLEKPESRNTHHMSGPHAARSQGVTPICEADGGCVKRSSKPWTERLGATKPELPPLVADPACKGSRETAQNEKGWGSVLCFGKSSISVSGCSASSAGGSTRPVRQQLYVSSDASKDSPVKLLNAFNRKGKETSDSAM